MGQRCISVPVKKKKKGLNNEVNFYGYYCSAAKKEEAFKILSVPRILRMKYASYMVVSNTFSFQ